MTRLLVDPFTAPYMQRALLMAVLLGVMAGLVGVHVSLRRLAFMADTYTHTVFPGMAVAFAMGTSITAGALVSGVFSAVVFTVIGRSRRVTSDAALAVTLTSFFALGVVVIGRTERYTADLTGLLFGRILTVDRTQIIEVALVLATVAAVLALTHKELVLVAFDPDGAAALGYPTGRIDLFVNILIVLVVVAAARSVGTLLTMALLITPAATARLVSRSVGAMSVTAAGVGALGGWLGLGVSHRLSVTRDLRLAPAATIVVATTVLFAVVLVGRTVARSVERRDTGPRAG